MEEVGVRVAPTGHALKKYLEEIGASVTYSACAEKYLEEVGVRAVLAAGDAA
jgi:hypothetical protein